MARFAKHLRAKWRYLPQYRSSEAVDSTAVPIVSIGRHMSPKKFGYCFVVLRVGSKLSSCRTCDLANPLSKLQLKKPGLWVQAGACPVCGLSSAQDLRQSRMFHRRAVSEQ